MTTPPLQADLFTSLASGIEIPRDGTLSRTLLQNDAVKVVLFAFSAGQELSEHTASMPAFLHLVSGAATWGLGADRKEARPGDWAYMPAHLPHRVSTQEPTVMLLILLKGMKAPA